jgi:hypothetical protein
MKHIQKVIIPLILFLLLSCEKKENIFDFEKSVMTEIFPILIDSVCVDTRLFTNPPPMYGKYITDASGHVSIDTTQATENQRKKLAEWKKGVEKVKNDTSKVIIAFDPKISPFEKEYEKIISKNSPNDTLIKIITDSSKVYVLDFKRIKLNGKFKLKNIHEFDERNIFERDYKFNFSGVFEVSGIKFDKKKENGILDVGFTCGRLCGYGNTVFIKKVKNKWRIVKMEPTWIS